MNALPILFRGIRVPLVSLAILLATSEFACTKSATTVDPDLPTSPPVQLVTLSFEGKTHQVNGDCVAGCIGVELDGKFWLRIALPERRVMTATIDGFSGKTGSFPFGYDHATIEVETGPGNPTYATGSYTCYTEQTITSPGELHITKMADQAGEYLEGNFNTTIYPKNNCGGKGSEAISCTFKVLRER